jgi:hypothetical protein
MGLFAPLLPQAQLCDAFKTIAMNATSKDRDLLAGERLLDGMFFFHNPFARRPLAPEVFRNPSVAQACFDRNAEEFIHERPEGHLLFRSVQNLRVKK